MRGNGELNVDKIPLKTLNLLLDKPIDLNGSLYFNLDYNIDKNFLEIQEINSMRLLNCIFKHYKNYKKTNRCEERRIKPISQELFKRFVVPLYIFILSLVSSSLIIKPKKNLYAKYHKFSIFILGFFIMVISQISFKFVSESKNLDLTIISFPIIMIFFYYIFLFSKTKFNFKVLWLLYNIKIRYLWKK